MAKPQQPPSHLPLVFTRDTYMQRVHVYGAPSQQDGEDMMIIVKMGEEARVTYGIALDLLVADTAVRKDKADNGDRISEIRATAKEIADRAARPAKAHKQPTQSFEDKMDAFFDRLTAFMTGKKQTA